MGTYILRPHIPSVPTTTTDGGAWSLGGTAASLADGVLADADGKESFAVAFHSSFYLSSFDWYLDGSLVPTAFASLPAGFTVLSAAVWLTVPGGFETVFGNVFLRFDAFTESGAFVAADYVPFHVSPDTSSIDYPYPTSPVPTALDLNNNLMGARYATTGGLLAQNIFNLDSLFIAGNYTPLNFSWTVPQNNDSVEVGDIISITSSGPNALDLTQLTISLACGVVVPIVQTANLFTFAVPGSCSGNGVTAITATGNGVQFSGSVPLGYLTILLTNASGIYTLTPGATHDTLYSSLRDGSTRNVKIPDPFAKTGYGGG